LSPESKSVSKGGSTYTKKQIDTDRSEAQGIIKQGYNKLPFTHNTDQHQSVSQQLWHQYGEGYDTEKRGTTPTPRITHHPIITQPPQSSSSTPTPHRHPHIQIPSSNARSKGQSRATQTKAITKQPITFAAREASNQEERVSPKLSYMVSLIYTQKRHGKESSLVESWFHSQPNSTHK
jgi:hypothetical protein